MSSMVTPCSASRSRGLRSSTRGYFAVIRTNLKFGNRVFSVAGPREWNCLPVSVRQCTSVAQFKSKLKTHLPRQQKINEMNGAHLASPIRGELGYAHWPQLGTQIHSPIGNQIWGPLGKDDVALTLP